jgi:hypothetical protein
LSDPAVKIGDGGGAELSVEAALEEPEPAEAGGIVDPLPPRPEPGPV